MKKIACYTLYTVIAALVMMTGCDEWKGQAISSPCAQNEVLTSDGHCLLWQGPARIDQERGVCLDLVFHKYPDCGKHAFQETQGSCRVPDVVFYLSRPENAKTDLLAYCALLEAKQMNQGPR